MVFQLKRKARSHFLDEYRYDWRNSRYGQYFHGSYETRGFRNMIKKDFKKYNDLCISAFLEGETQPLFDNLKHLSSLVLQNFKPMIPDSFQKYWEDGLESNAYYLKLCGSGGGGFILGFTRDYPKAQKMLHGQDLEVIYKF